MGNATWRLAAVMVLVLLLTGCAVGQGDGAGSATTQEETTVNGSEVTTVYKEETTVLADDPYAGIPRPPDSTLSYGGREVKGTLGSYCWTSGDVGGCIDAPPLIPSKQKTLTVPPDSEMVFRYSGQVPLNTVQIGARPLGKKGGPHPTLKAHGSGVERTIPAKMPPGEYVLDVFVKKYRGGDAVYYFRIMVE